MSTIFSLRPSDLGFAAVALLEFYVLLTIFLFFLRAIGRVSRTDFDAPERLVDVFLSAWCLVLALPAIVFGSAALWLSSRESVLIPPSSAEARGVGLRGREFRLYRLRAAPTAEYSDGPQGGFRRKPPLALTGVARLLQRSGVSCLPELINVLKGDMALFGPRPMRVEDLVALPGKYRARLDMKPGLFSEWQRVRCRLDFLRWKVVHMIDPALQLKTEHNLISNHLSRPVRAIGYNFILALIVVAKYCVGTFAFMKLEEEVVPYHPPEDPTSGNENGNDGSR